MQIDEAKKLFLDGLYKKSPELIEKAVLSLPHAELINLLLSPVEGEEGTLVLHQLLREPALASNSIDKCFNTVLESDGLINEIIKSKNCDLLMASANQISKNSDFPTVRERLRPYIHKILELGMSDSKPLLEVLFSTQFLATLGYFLEDKKYTPFDFIDNETFVHLLLESHRRPEGGYWTLINGTNFMMPDFKILYPWLNKALTEISLDNPQYVDFVDIILKHLDYYNFSESLKRTAINACTRELLYQFSMIDTQPEKFQSLCDEASFFIKKYENKAFLKLIVDIIVKNSDLYNEEIVGNIYKISMKLNDIDNTNKIQLFGLQFSAPSAAILKNENAKYYKKNRAFPPLVEKELCFDLILNYLLDKYNKEGKPNQPKPGKKGNARWTSYEQRVSHYAKIHQFMLSQQTIDSRLGEKLGEQFVPELDNLVSSSMRSTDRYKKLIKVLPGISSIILTFRFQEMLERFQLLSDKGENAPHPIKMITHLLNTELNKPQQRENNAGHLMASDSPLNNTNDNHNNIVNLNEPIFSSNDERKKKISKSI